MGSRADRVTAPRRAMAACAAIAALLTTGAHAHAQSDGQELLDRAIESLEFRDDAAYQEAIDGITTSNQWFPSTLERALDERDLDLIIMVWSVIDAPDNDVLRTAMEMLSQERDGLLYGDPDDSRDRTELGRADRRGLTALETVEHRGLPITAEITAALSLLPASDDEYPIDTVYDTAITQLAAIMAGTLTTSPALASDSPIGSPTIGAAVNNAPLGAPVDTVGPATPPESAGAAPWTALGGISVAAVVLGLFALRRSREAHGLASLANTDGLTGLHNRRKFDADIEEYRDRGDAPVAMLMVDVDRFNDFNDQHGHATGDDVLRLVGEALHRSIREDDVAYRYGGEEFCALLPKTTTDEAHRIAERIRLTIEAIDLPVAASLTASVGLAAGPSSDVDALIEHADAALYAAKASGRNCVVAA